jgi:Transglutaminase-like superfamily
MGILFWEALIGLLLYDLFLFGRNFRRMRRFVMNWKIAKRPAAPDVVDRVCKAVNYAGVWYPKRVLCLQRSAVTTCLLRSHGVAAQMVTGAQKAPFKAHAWTEVNGRAINERRDVQAVYGVWERC